MIYNYNKEQASAALYRGLTTMPVVGDCLPIRTIVIDSVRYYKLTDVNEELPYPLHVVLAKEAPNSGYDIYNLIHSYYVPWSWLSMHVMDRCAKSPRYQEAANRPFVSIFLDHFKDPFPVNRDKSVSFTGPEKVQGMLMLDSPVSTGYQDLQPLPLMIPIGESKPAIATESEPFVENLHQVETTEQSEVILITINLTPETRARKKRIEVIVNV